AVILHRTTPTRAAGLPAEPDDDPADDRGAREPGRADLARSRGHRPGGPARRARAVLEQPAPAARRAGPGDGLRQRHGVLRRLPCRHPRQHGLRAQRDHRAHRPLGLREVDAAPVAQPDERPRRRCSRRGPRQLPRHEHLRARRRPDRGPAPHRHGLPEAEPVPQVHLRQHRLRPEGHRHEGREHGRPGRGVPVPCRPVGRGQGQAQAVGVRPLRRAAAAALHRPDARSQARRDSHGRAVLGARPDRHRAHRGPHGRAAQRLHDHHRHPQHAAGGPRRGPHGVLHRARRRDDRQP
ncbi:MAG: Phosphate transport ATP-binding protein PstB, partial [uncultured Nocardioidaceae bacterium]